MLSIRLCQALNEKISHDFAGLMGAIDNSMRLIQSKEYQDKAITLVQSSIGKLIGRLQFYRHLYSIPCDNSNIEIGEINKLSINFLKLKNNNIKLTFQGFTTTPIKDSISKMIMCLIFIATDSLKKEGMILVNLEVASNNSFVIKVIVTDKQLRFDENKNDILLGKGDAQNINTDNIHEYYTYYLTTECGYKLEINPTLGSIEYILQDKNN
ncbi:histidine phosphotransferase family protein [Candidatus Tisiphia endosymbiont of Beris chalybata]|uniref:histidine phosphotransferase family protein n=1 Tax=Candidatus Tisiphia endosymbiont of Beris chalybata TaxID=3066262 RepID=UPI00312C8039